jgi:tetratricopeptide (TPR) repeat protein
MPDLSKHLARAKQAFDKGNNDLCIEVCLECVDVDPTQADVYKLLLPAAKRRAKETGAKTSLFEIGTLTGLIPGKDPHKAFAAAIKRVAKNPTAKALVDAMELAARMAGNGVKAMIDVAVILGEEHRATGMFSDKVLWALAHLHMDRYKASGSKDDKALDAALKAMHDLDHAMPNHPEAGRTVKNWEAMRSMAKRTGAATGDYRGQLANDATARRAEVMSKLVRTVEDAREVLKFLDEDLAKTPGDKQMWLKKGDTHRRIQENDQAKQAYEKALAIDPHDFTITIRLSDLKMLEERRRLEAMPAGPEAEKAKAELLNTEIDEYRKRVERQPTDMGHRFQLGQRLFLRGDIDGAASEFQRTVNDPRLRRNSHGFLAKCFGKKNLLDLAIQQYKLFLPLVEDELSDEAKEARYQLARLYEAQGNTAEAIATFEILLGKDLAYRDAAARLSKLRGA